MKRLRLSEVSLRTRFILGMSTMLVPLVLGAVGTVVVFERMLGAIHGAVEEASEELAVLWRLQLLLERANVSLQDCLIEGRSAEACPAFSDSRQVVDSAFAQAASAPFGLAEERALLMAAQEQWQRAGDIGAAVLADSGPRAGFSGGIAELDVHLGRAVDLLEKAHHLSEGEMAMSVISARSSRRSVLLLVVSLLVLGVAVAAAGATALARSILIPIGALERGAAEFARGDLDYRVPVSHPPELNRLASTFNHMAESLRMKELALADLSVRDPLTNVFNRRELLRRLSVEIERSRRYREPFALLFLDADGFKTINDAYGHQAGDAVLSRFATIIEGAVRPTDVVGRYGGDEFAVVVPRASRAGGLAIAERIREALATQWVAGAPGWPPPVTTSIGLAVFPDDAPAQAELIRAADHAVYEAKEAGGNGVRSAGQA